VITRGVNLNEYIGKEFEIQGVRFYGTEESAPCYWMDGAFAPGAKDFLKGRGGLRAKILSDGELRSTVSNGHLERSEGPLLRSLRYAKERT
jgi:MOSC domain-containing protein YiiM